MSLASLIVQRGLATVREVEEALARQVLYGGDLLTNLLEVTELDEVRALACMADVSGLSAVAAGALPPPQEEMRRFVSRELIVKHAFVPLTRDAGAPPSQRTPLGASLIIVVGQPLSVDALQELSFSLSFAVVQRVALFVRVKEALLRDYDVPIERRYQRLLVKMSGNSSHVGSTPPVLQRGPNAYELGPVPSVFPSPGARALAAGGAVSHAFAAVAPPMSAGAAPMSALPATAHAPGVTPASGRVPATQGSHAFEPTPTPTSIAAPRRHSLRPLKRRRGPLVAAIARHELDSAPERDDVFDVLFEYSRQFFDYTVLFAVNGDFVEGWDAFGEGLNRERVVLLGYPLDVASLVGRARSDGTPLVVPFARTGLDAVIVSDLHLTGSVSPLVVPVMLKGRCIAIVLGVVRDAAIDGGSIGEIVAFAGAAASALERVIVRRKLTSIPPSMREPAPVTQREASRGLPAAAASDRGLPEDDERHAILADAARHLSSRPARIVDAASVASFEVPSTRVLPHPSRPEIITPLRGVQTVGEGDANPTPPRLPSTHPSRPPPSVRPSRPSRPPSARPSSSGRSVEARRPPVASQSSEPSLPSVIVDVTYEFAASVDRYLGGDDEASVTLLRAGASAMPAVMARFPGPVTLNAERLPPEQPLPRVVDCGPLFKLIAGQRRIAVPFVLEHVGDQRVPHRFWATFLLVELRYVEVARPLVSRLFDDERSVRRVANEALRALAEAHPSATVDALARVALDTEVSATQRNVVIAALGALEHSSALAPLVHALDDESDEVIVAADAALGVLTRHDFGGSRAAWRDFQARLGGANRAEWLIEALVSSTEELGALANTELVATARQDFGYASTMPSQDKLRAQKKAREWWAETTRAR